MSEFSLNLKTLAQFSKHLHKSVFVFIKQCYLYKNEQGQNEIVTTLLPSSTAAGKYTLYMYKLSYIVLCKVGEMLVPVHVDFASHR